jgi:predicted transglutaminase-like cysteine proteinase
MPGRTGLRAAYIAAVAVMQVLGASGALGADPTPTREFQVAALPSTLTERGTPAPALQGSNGDLAPLRSGTFWRKWRAVEEEIAAEAIVLMRCRAEPEKCDSPAAKTFIAIIDAAHARDGRARIGELNRAINLALRPVSDLVQHGVPDLWSSPLVTLTSGQGDCEDYAIAKLVALRELGFSDQDLRLLVVHERDAHALHAVAAVRFEGRWLVLDNRRFAMIDLAYTRFTWQVALQYEAQLPAVAAVADPRISVTQDFKATDAATGSSGAPLLL